MHTRVNDHRGRTAGWVLAWCTLAPFVFSGCAQPPQPPPPPPEPQIEVGGLSDGQTVRGAIRVAVSTTPAEASAVEFRLDERPAELDSSPPFEYARADLLDGPHTLTVTAYNGAGAVAAKAVGFASQTPLEEARWTSSTSAADRIKPMPMGLVETDSVAVGGKVYTIGGFGLAEGSFARRKWGFVYDPATNEWNPIADYPGLPIDHPALASPDDKTIYLIGGMTAYPDTAVRTVWAYDTATNTWDARPRASLPAPRGAGVARVIDGLVYYAGGIHAKEAHASLFRYDPAADRWDTLTPMSEARDHLTGEVVNGKLYAIGGRRGWGKNDERLDLQILAKNEVYDPATDSWTTLAPMPTARAGLGSGVIGGKIVVMGGEHIGQKTFAQTEAYNPATDSWQALSEMVTARHGTRAATTGARIYVAGGGPDYGIPGQGGGVGEGRCSCGPGWWTAGESVQSLLAVHEAFGFDAAP